MFEWWAGVCIYHVSQRPTRQQCLSTLDLPTLRPGPLPKPIASRPVSPLTFYGPQVPRCPTTAIAIKREEEIDDM
ncbi:hypothetical protein BGX38DRAFT_1154859 [Terfezia claveryi]|nr:hypothetical protein BGX38DRAFT_1154859 [Terfezia claveryi]